MPEVTIRYKKPETLKILKSLAEYFDFVIAPKNKLEETGQKPDDAIMIPGDRSLDLSVLDNVFLGKNMEPRQLRRKEWGRKRQSLI